MSAEQIIQVGAGNPLTGVLTLPAGPIPSSCLVILNSGLMHHVGTCNLSVKLARTAAARDYAACRFDFSGVGDSVTRRFDGSHEAREISEVKEVLDYLQAHYGMTRFALFGLCSGADAALATAAVDDRICNIVQIDPFSVRTPIWYWRRVTTVLARLPHREFWVGVRQRLLGSDSNQDGIDGEFLEAQDPQARHRFDRRSLTETYRKLIAFETRVLVFMTRAQSDTYNYEGQFRDSFPRLDFGALLRERYLPQTRHIVTEPEDQELILRETIDWITRT